jgi:hypothetical protein
MQEPDQPPRYDEAVPVPVLRPGTANDDTVEFPPIITGPLLTRRQVAKLFRVTSAKVATWARRGRLPEVRDEDGKPRYRQADVYQLYASGYGQGGRQRNG